LGQSELVALEFPDPDHERKSPGAAREAGGLGIEERKLVAPQPGDPRFPRPGFEHIQRTGSPKGGGIDAAGHRVATLDDVGIAALGGDQLAADVAANGFIARLAGRFELLRTHLDAEGFEAVREGRHI
jgi:hypothetical protein